MQVKQTLIALDQLANTLLAGHADEPPSARDASGERHAGVIAQEVLEVLPEVVDSKGEYMAVAYGNMVVLLIEVIKEQQVQIEELNRRIG